MGKKFEERFIETFWEMFNVCRSEEEYANLLAWIYFQVSESHTYIPFNATIAQIWTACPSAINNFVEHGGSSLAALMISATRNELKNMSKEELEELKHTIIPAKSHLYVINRGGTDNVEIN